MRISSIPQIYRHVNRWREIISVLSRYGLANWVSRLGLDFANDLFKDSAGETLANHTWERRVRLALNELGPTFIKLGQVLSTRPDLVGAALAEELTYLQDEVTPDAPQSARETIFAELGRGVDELFAEWDDVPMASASIGQVHAARLMTGESVVVKVQHANIEDKVRVDLDILGGLGIVAERLPEMANYRPRETIAEFQRTLRRELDFELELRHMQQFARDFAGDPRVCVPCAYPSMSTSRVLVMQRLRGIKLGDVEALSIAGTDPSEIARRCAELYLEMIFRTGFYHADPHPGNIILMQGQVVGLLDFGMIGRIDERMRENVVEMLLAVVQGDSQQLVTIITRVCRVPRDLDLSLLTADASDYVAHYANQSLEQLDLTCALRELIDIIRRWRIVLPSSVAMLIKVLVMLEGTLRQLSPRFSVMELMEPYRKQLLIKRFSPTARWRRLRRMWGEYERLAELLPRGLADILEQVQRGVFDVHLDHRGLEPSVNRLVLGMITSAMFLGSTLLMAHQVPPLLYLPPVADSLSVPGAAACGVSLFLGLRLLRAINKSGHLDRRDHADHRNP